jgi:putative transferase (TIGR04331 family)
MDPRIFAQQSPASSVTVIGGALHKALNRSKLVICFYPDTAFLEAILSGVPTILVFDPAVSMLDKSCDFLLDDLKEASMLFYSPVEAASFLNQIHPQISAWWSSKIVRDAVEKILRYTGQSVGDTLTPWVDFFIGIGKSCDGLFSPGEFDAKEDEARTELGTNLDSHETS